MVSFTALITAALVASAMAHDMSPAEIARRNTHAIAARATLSKCSEKLKARDFVERRLARRDQLIGQHVQKRNLEFVQDLSRRQDTNSSVCILAPEVTVGPYYLGAELIREDISEGGAGIPLLMDFQFIDVNTCNPVPQAMIDIWHCNSTGVYSGYEVEGTAGESFNRGLQPTDSDGIMHMKTSFPGWYAGRATHIHLAAHIDGTVNTEKMIYEGGMTTHIGQVFMPEDILSQIDTAETYNTNKVTRMKNSEDGIFAEESTGNNAVADVTMLGASITDGFLATISIGIDLSSNQTDALNGGAGGPGGSGPGGAPPSGVPSGGPRPSGSASA